MWMNFMKLYFVKEAHEIFCNKLNPRGKMWADDEDNDDYQDG